MERGGGRGGERERERERGRDTDIWIESESWKSEDVGHRHKLMWSLDFFLTLLTTPLLPQILSCH